jgi:hypothetical protein
LWCGRFLIVFKPFGQASKFWQEMLSQQCTHKAFYTVWKRYGFTPEGFNLATSSVQVR